MDETEVRRFEGASRCTARKPAEEVLMGNLLSTSRHWSARRRLHSGQSFLHSFLPPWRTSFALLGFAWKVFSSCLNS